MASIRSSKLSSMAAAAAMLVAFAIAGNYSGAQEAAAPTAAPASGPLKIAYSDWPGWVAWEIAIQKGWFKEEGVEVEFSWMEYAESMSTFASGKVDAVAMTNGDAMVTGGTANKASKGILINDYSNGNDMIIAKPGIESIKDLKGKKIGVETGFVDHLLLLKALEANGLKEEDVTLVNTVTTQTPQALSSGQVDAIAAWQPNSGQALKELPGSKAIFTSADAPGLIYDLLYVSNESLAARRDDWKRVVKVWMKVADYMADDKNKEEMLKILSARVGLTPEAYAPLLAGTKIMGLEANAAAYKKGEGLDSVYGSSKIANEFNVANKVYEKSQDVDSYLYPDLVNEIAAEK